MQLGPGTASLACARLIVPFAPFNITAERKREENKIDGFDGFIKVWRENEATQRRETQLKEIRVFLELLRLPEGLTKKAKQLFL